MDNLLNHYQEELLTNVPESIYYISNFISPEEENELLEQIYKVPKPKWTQLSGRRLQNWGGLPHPKGMVSEPMPQACFVSLAHSSGVVILWLTKYTKKINKLGCFGEKSPNHVLVNEYKPGEGIMPHLDGPLFNPVISTISLGSGTCLEFYLPRAEDDESLITGRAPLASIYLAPRSLVVVKDEMYTKYLHGISEREIDLVSDQLSNLRCHPELVPGTALQRSTRVSLTIRHVPRVLKLKLRLGK